jgi:hypothetical protein
MAVERVDYSSDEEYQQALQQEQEEARLQNEEAEAAAQAEADRH